MRPNWVRLRQWCVRLSYGGLALGFLQGFQMIDWASWWTSLLSTWLTIIVNLLFGGSASGLTT